MAEMHHIHYPPLKRSTYILQRDHRSLKTYKQDFVSPPPFHPHRPPAIVPVPPWAPDSETMPRSQPRFVTFSRLLCEICLWEGHWTWWAHMGPPLWLPLSRYCVKSLRYVGLKRSPLYKLPATNFKCTLCKTELMKPILLLDKLHPN